MMTRPSPSPARTSPGRYDAGEDEGPPVLTHLDAARSARCGCNGSCRCCPTGSAARSARVMAARSPSIGGAGRSGYLGMPQAGLARPLGGGRGPAEARWHRIGRVARRRLLVGRPGLRRTPDVPRTARVRRAHAPPVHADQAPHNDAASFVLPADLRRDSPPPACRPATQGSRRFAHIASTSGWGRRPDRRWPSPPSPERVADSADQPGRMDRSRLPIASSLLIPSAAWTRAGQ